MSLRICKGYYCARPKCATFKEVSHAIDEVLAGRQYRSPKVPKVPTTRHRITAAPGFEFLTEQEQQVVRFVGAGWTSKEIAKELKGSIWTVHSMRKKIRRHLGLKNNKQFEHYCWTTVMCLAGPEDSHDGTSP
jgi:DNA-binding NarL/FixJ family response regulator